MADALYGRGAPPPPPPPRPGTAQSLAATSSSSLSQAQRARLEVLRDRERRKDQLIEKFRHQLGSGAGRGASDASSTTSKLRREVDTIAEGSVSITSSRLSDLEQRLLRHQGRRQIPNDFNGSMVGGGGGSSTSSNFGNGTPCQGAGAHVPSVSDYSKGSTIPSLSCRLSARSGNSRGGKPPAMAPGSLSARFAASGTSGPSGSRLPASARQEQGEGQPPDQPQQQQQLFLPASPTSAGSPHVPAVEWALLDKIAAQQHWKDNKLQRQRDLELKHRLKADLDRQMADTKLLKDREKMEDTMFRQLQDFDLAAWKEEEQRLHEERLQKTLMEHSDRSARVVEEAERRRLEKLQEREEEKLLLERDQEEVARQQRLAEELVGKRREQAQQLHDTSELSRSIREEQLRTHREREEKSILAYERTKAMREQKVKDQKKDESHRRQVLEAQANERALALRLQEQQAAARTAEQLIAQNEEVMKREAEVKEVLAKKRHETMAFNALQMQAKQERDRAEAERLSRIRDRTESDARRFQEEQKRKADARKAQHLQNRAELERQIAKRVPLSVAGSEIMSAAEFQMNKALLDGIVEVA
mmetsp:Transcript_47408/g.102115  ORF Transcript_47408/g.102115 Transcript_47408/m.102115 type:complete len:589 (-) Transcript_47408:134-1900(-)